MSFVSWPWRNSAASAPVSSSLPRSERSTTPALPRSSSYSVATVTGPILGRPARLLRVALADDFQLIVDSLPPDWTNLVCDLRIFDEDRYIEAATILVQINAQPYSKHDWHWRLPVAHEFGHAAPPETVYGTLALLDDQGIAGELAARDARSGRVEVVPGWGRPESVR